MENVKIKVNDLLKVKSFMLRGNRTPLVISQEIRMMNGFIDELYNIYEDAPESEQRAISDYILELDEVVSDLKLDLLLAEAAVRIEMKKQRSIYHY